MTPPDLPTRPDPRPDPPVPPPATGARGPERLAEDIALLLGLLLAFAWLALDLLRPFATLLVWTVVIAAALHPAFGWLYARLGGRRRLAATLITIAALAVVLGPIAMLTASLVETAEWLTARARSGQLRLPVLPEALLDMPGIGAALASNWDLANSNLEGFVARYGRTLLGAGEVAVRPAVRFAEGAATFLAAVSLSGFLHLSGETLAETVRRFTGRVLGPRNARFVDIAGATIRNVARGVIGVAAIQALLIGVALIVAGVPAAGLLTLAALVLAIVQIGALPVVLPILAWAWFERDGATAALAGLRRFRRRFVWSAALDSGPDAAYNPASRR